MKIFIIGASGLIGSKLLDQFSKRHNVIGTYFSSHEKAVTYKNVIHLDVCRHEVVERAVLEFNPDVVIYAASIRPDDCENDPELAKAVNLSGLQNVASICASLHKRLVYLSSDYVFSGHEAEYFEDSPVRPINHFGKMKAEAEAAVRHLIDDHIILRSSMVYGYAPYTELRGLVNFLVAELSAGRAVEVDSEVKRYPVLADDVADLVDLLLQRGEKGTFHASTETPLTKLEFAQLVCDIYGLKTELLKPVTDSEVGLPAQRPNTIRLNTDKVKGLGFYGVEPIEGLKIHRRQMSCSFRLIYSVRPDILVAGQNASEFRIAVGKALAKEAPAPGDADCVIPIPESGIYSATGFSAESGVPFYMGIIRDYFTEKTLYSPTPELRRQMLNKKLIPIETAIWGKSIVLVDEAMISGSTLGVVIQMLRDLKAREIHVRIPSPVMSARCTGRVLPKAKLAYGKFEGSSKEEFERQVAAFYGADSFRFLSLDSFRSCAHAIFSLCTDCFLNGKIRS